MHRGSRTGVRKIGPSLTGLQKIGPRRIQTDVVASVICRHKPEQRTFRFFQTGTHALLCNSVLQLVMLFGLVCLLAWLGFFSLRYVQVSSALFRKTSIRRSSSTCFDCQGKAHGDGNCHAASRHHLAACPDSFPCRAVVVGLKIYRELKSCSPFACLV